MSQGVENRLHQLVESCMLSLEEVEGPWACLHMAIIIWKSGYAIVKSNKTPF